ncbi:hypothetical protein B0T20DRAFT_102423 [Sordaria brevicollis]|uniref:Uncharacterized protein n=1 Tax=Sordaria brevicollis TaxID=83679 RepID=A0AAE0U313_SORBR|nr:hypothetical protein B0T20DRAFT_102423 [Sordaria brevicollis]
MVQESTACVPYISAVKKGRRRNIFISLACSHFLIEIFTKDLENLFQFPLIGKARGIRRKSGPGTASYPRSTTAPITPLFPHFFSATSFCSAIQVTILLKTDGKKAGFERQSIRGTWIDNSSLVFSPPVAWLGCNISRSTLSKPGTICRSTSSQSLSGFFLSRRDWTHLVDRQTNEATFTTKGPAGRISKTEEGKQKGRVSQRPEASNVGFRQATAKLGKPFSPKAAPRLTTHPRRSLSRLADLATPERLIIVTRPDQTRTLPYISFGVSQLPTLLGPTCFRLSTFDFALTTQRQSKPQPQPISSRNLRVANTLPFPVFVQVRFQ